MWQLISSDVLLLYPLTYLIVVGLRKISYPAVKSKFLALSLKYTDEHTRCLAPGILVCQSVYEPFHLFSILIKPKRQLTMNTLF